MADTYKRATNNDALSNDIKEFAKTFYQNFRKNQESQQLK
jgi:hypothetical protein